MRPEFDASVVRHGTSSNQWFVVVGTDGEHRVFVPFQHLIYFARVGVKDHDISSFTAYHHIARMRKVGDNRVFCIHKVLIFVRLCTTILAGNCYRPEPKRAVKSARQNIFRIG